MRLPLDDKEIIELYWERDERAIYETDRKYRKYLFAVAYNILYTEEDCEECLNDTYMGAWGAMPPERPLHLLAFLTTIIRRASINKYNEMNRQRRIPSNLTSSLDELEAVLSSEPFEDETESQRLAAVISDFIRSLEKRRRYIFMSRYYMGEPIDKIASELSLSRSSVNKELAAIRESLRAFLKREGYTV